MCCGYYFDNPKAAAAGRGNEQQPAPNGAEPANPRLQNRQNQNHGNNSGFGCDLLSAIGCGCGGGNGTLFLAVVIHFTNIDPTIDNHADRRQAQNAPQPQPAPRSAAPQGFNPPAMPPAVAVAGPEYAQPIPYGQPVVYAAGAQPVVYAQAPPGGQYIVYEQPPPPQSMIYPQPAMAYAQPVPGIAHAAPVDDASAEKTKPAGLLDRIKNIFK